MGVAERREREKQQRRADILSAAKEVFFAKGLESATMDEIADKAEYSKGTLYLYFQSKEDLYLSLLDKGNQIFYSMLRKAIKPDESAEQRLKKAADVYYRFYNDYTQYFMIMISLQQGHFVNHNVSEDLYRSCMNQGMAILHLIEQVVQDGVDNGEFKNVDPWVMTLLLMSTAEGIFCLIREKIHKEFMKGVDRQSLLNFALTIFLEGLRK